jgi:uncharacterized protein
MQMANRFSIAVHILALLVMSQETEQSSEWMARSIGVHAVIVRNIMAMLRRAGLIQTQQGVAGGSFSRPINDITLLDVYRAVEKQGSLFSIHPCPNPNCPVGGHIQQTLEQVYGEAQQALEAQLASRTVADIVCDLEKAARTYSHRFAKEIQRMKIVLFGATGNIGQRIAQEALARGHEVVGVVRDPAQYQAVDERMALVQGDATDAATIATVVQGADAVVNAISPRPSSYGLSAPSVTDAARAFIAGLPKAGVKRLIVVGGAGSLEVASGLALVDTPDFPEVYKSESLAGREALRVYRNEASGLEWTYISPAAVIGPGERTGKYRTTDDQLLVDDQGNSFISFEDYAVAVVDELERPQHISRRFGVAY